MKTIKLTPAQYLKQIDLGYLVHVECVSVFKKIVNRYKCGGEKEQVLIDLKY